MKLSRVICDNSDKIEDIQVYAMVLPDHEINPRVPCNSNLLPRIDLTRFKGENIQGVFLTGTPLKNLSMENLG